MTADGFDFIGFLIKKKKTKHQQQQQQQKKQQVCNHIFTSLAFFQL